MHERENGALKHHCENHERCMQMIQAVLDGSASKEELEHIKSEIDMCLPCIEGYKEYKALKSRLHGDLERKKCPEATVSNIKATVGIGFLLLLGFILHHI